MYLTKLQRSVISKANRELKKHSWFRGVCLDLFKQGAALHTDNLIRKEGTHRAVQMVMDDTHYWDGWCP